MNKKPAITAGYIELKDQFMISLYLCHALFPVLSWCYTITLFKVPDENPAVCIADIRCNIMDALPGITE